MWERGCTTRRRKWLVTPVPGNEACHPMMNAPDVNLTSDSMAVFRLRPLRCRPVHHFYCRPPAHFLYPAVSVSPPSCVLFLPLGCLWFLCQRNPEISQEFSTLLLWVSAYEIFPKIFSLYNLFPITIYEKQTMEYEDRKCSYIFSLPCSDWLKSILAVYHQNKRHERMALLFWAGLSYELSLRYIISGSLARYKVHTTLYVPVQSVTKIFRYKVEN